MEMGKLLSASVEQFGVKLRSRLERTTWRVLNGPRKDHEIVQRYLLRGLHRAGGCEVDEVIYSYVADWYGPMAWQYGKVRALRPATEAQRRLFTGLRLPPHLWYFNFMDPDIDIRIRLQ